MPPTQSEIARYTAQDDVIEGVPVQSLCPCRKGPLDLAAAKQLKRGQLVELLIGPEGAKQWFRGIALCSIPASTSASSPKPCMTDAGQMDYALIPLQHHVQATPFRYIPEPVH